MDIASRNGVSASRWLVSGHTLRLFKLLRTDEAAVFDIPVPPLKEAKLLPLRIDDEGPRQWTA